MVNGEKKGKKGKWGGKGTGINFGGKAAGSIGGWA